ncbi:head-tail adaptor protein [Defluviimonas sp. WL0024]|uniref:Head-tail adaptor protein n=1 Tax=Albidovulum salinarum TaxID=2984153 RepID=A0ABT2X443_9RHOB|nr:head-tail adaptor protein [Defluviimonas sp. WL0024]MCU9848716.1 head-tail adaptor protein [Defluviimonas sp. WL0024]
MSAPRLNRKLVLEEAQRVPDGAGGWSLNWVVLGALWAAVDAGAGGERAGEFLTVSSVSYRITVRGAPQGAPSRPKPEQRFRDGARTFRISAVTEADPVGKYLTCFAQEEVVA